MASAHAGGPPAEPPTSASPDAIVADDVLCTGCGYDLRRLAIDANCPECGRSIRQSLEGHLLAGADPKWLRRITRGAGLLAWGWGLIFLVPVAMFGVLLLAGIIVLITANDAPIAMYFTVLFIALPLTGLIGLVLIAVGTILLTMLDPRETLREPPLSARRMARLGMVGALSAYLMILPVAAMFRITTLGQVLTIILGALVVLSIALGVAGVLYTLATVVARVPDPKQAKRLQSSAKFFAGALPLLVAVFVAGDALGVWGPAGMGSRWEPMFGCFYGLLVLGILVKGVHTCVLIFRSRRMIRWCIMLAEVQSQYDRNSPQRRTSSVAQ